jgi:hypothetical protein
MVAIFVIKGLRELNLWSDGLRRGAKIRFLI